MRAMIFEDNALLAGTLADALTRLGHEVTSQASSSDDAMKAAMYTDVDFAVADLDLRGVMAYPVLDQLSERGIPFVMATSTSARDIPGRFKAVPTVSKPYNMAELRGAIALIGDHAKDACAPCPH